MDFPVELFSCGIRHDARRLFLPLMCTLSLLLSVLVLWGGVEALRSFQRAGGGAALLPIVAGTVFVGMLFFLGLNVPFELRVATADEDLPLVMLTGLSSRALWRARVCSAALPALAIPVVHTPLLAFLYTMGGVRLADFGSLAVFWLAGWVLSIGWAALAGCTWPGAGRDRMQGLALTFLFAFFHGLILGIVVRVLSWMNSPWTWWVMQSFQPPWHGTGPEFARLAVHVVFGIVAAWASLVVLRGRWRTAVEVGSPKSGGTSSETITTISQVRDRIAEPSDDPLPVSTARIWSRPRCGADPWFWKDFHVAGGSWHYWWGRVAIAIAFTVLALFFCARSISGRYVEPVIVLTMVGWFIWMMFEAGQVLTVEFQDRMWSIVRITPNTVSTIMWSKLAAAAVKLTPSLLPLGVVLAFGLSTYAHMVVLAGFPALLLLSVPMAVLILYGTAIPQTLIGAGWPMVKTLVPVGVLIFVTGYIVIQSDNIPREWRAVILWCVFVVLSITSTIWLFYCMLCELNNPARERLSSDGG